MAANQTGSSGSGKAGKKIFVILGVVAAVVIIVLAGIIIYLVTNKDKEPAAIGTSAEPKEEREVLVTEENVKEVVEQMEAQEYVPPGYYTITQNYEWHFPKGSETSTDAHVENVPENTNDVYFDLFLSDNDEEPIYQSPVIPLGAVLEDFKLDTELSAGSYDCIMVYHLVDENQNTISTVSVTVKVIVEG